MAANADRKRLTCLLALGMILVIAAGLRIHGIALRSMSNDELGTLETTAGRGQIHLTLPRNIAFTPPPAVTSMNGAAPAWKVPLVMQSDVHPPLYFIALRLWQDIFGNSDAASRAMSALAGTLCVLAIFDVGRLLNGAAAGLWAALLMAIAQPQVIESQDARPYALAILLLLAAADALIRVVTTVDGRGEDISRRVRTADQSLWRSAKRTLHPPSFLLCVFLATACLTHYFILPAIAALGVYALISHRPKVLISFAIAGAIVLILWGFGMWEQRHNFSDPWMYWMTDTDPHHVTTTLMRFAALPIRFLAEPIGVNANAVAAVVYVLPWLLCKRRPEMALLGSWLLGCATSPAHVGESESTSTWSGSVK